MISCLSFVLSDLKQTSNNAFWEIDIGGEEHLTTLHAVNNYVQHNVLFNSVFSLHHSFSYSSISVSSGCVITLYSYHHHYI
jgi:hypothetical protein